MKYFAVLVAAVAMLMTTAASAAAQSAPEGSDVALLQRAAGSETAAQAIAAEGSDVALYQRASSDAAVLDTGTGTVALPDAVNAVATESGTSPLLYGIIGALAGVTLTVVTLIAMRTYRTHHHHGTFA